MKKDSILLSLYFHEDASYVHGLDEIRRESRDLTGREKARLIEYGSSNLSSRTIREIEDKIRSLIPQRRGSIVARRGYPLPLSNSKKLNLKNTPVLLVSSKEMIEYVFPCLIGEKYYTILEGLHFLRDNLPNLRALPGIMEDAITEHLLMHLPEAGLTLQSREAKTIAGPADLVFLDAEGRYVIVEVEREATDSALGQILRLAGAYEKQFGLPSSSVRAVIACIKKSEFIDLGADRGDVEIWKMVLN